MRDLQQALAERLTVWGDDLSAPTKLSVDDAGETHVTGQRTVYVLIVNQGGDTAFLAFGDTPTLDGTPLTVGIPYPYEIVPGTSLSFIVDTGEMADVHITEQLAGPVT